MRLLSSLFSCFHGQNYYLLNLYLLFVSYIIRKLENKFWKRSNFYGSKSNRLQVFGCECKSIRILRNVLFYLLNYLKYPESLILNTYDIENDKLIMVQIRVEFKGCISNYVIFGSTEICTSIYFQKYFHKIKTALSVYMCFRLSWLLDHVIYPKLRREQLLCKAEQIHKITKNLLQMFIQNNFEY